jgi:hypothetical protein
VEHAGEPIDALSWASWFARERLVRVYGALWPCGRVEYRCFFFHHLRI